MGKPRLRVDTTDSVFAIGFVAGNERNGFSRYFGIIIGFLVIKIEW